jgi:proline iminopeptidase
MEAMPATAARYQEFQAQDRCSSAKGKPMFATVRGVQMHYTAAGAGIPCIVPSLAGTPIYERTFSSPQLLQRLHLIFAELRANRTEISDIDALTLDAVVEDIDGLRRALGFETVAILGHSAHSILALAYAARYPQHTSHAIVVGGVPRISEETNARAAMYWDVVASPERKRLLAQRQGQLSDEAIRRMTPSQQIVSQYAARGAALFFDPSYDCTPLWEGHDNLSTALMARFWGPHGQFSTFDPDAGFPRISCPVFIAQGTFDFGAPPINWAMDRGKISDVTYHSFERSGHYPSVEEQETFDTAVGTWLGAR